MSIGLFDADFNINNTFVPNLELMKIYGYFKRKREIVSLSRDLDPNKYTEFYYFQNSNARINTKIWNYNNVKTIGMAFHPEKYVPMDEELEKMIPDKSVYDPIKSQFLTKIKNHDFDRVMRVYHLRLSLDNKTVWPQYKLQFSPNRARTFWLHDLDPIQIENSFEAIEALRLAYFPTTKDVYIGATQPLKFYSNEDFIKWFSIYKLNTMCSIELNFLPNKEVLLLIISDPTRYKNKIVLNINRENFEENDFLVRCLPILYKETIFLRTYRCNFLLKCTENFFSDKNWKKVLGLINIYNGRKSFYYDNNFTLHDFVKERVELTHYMTTDEAREIFLFVQKNNYELFKLFYDFEREKNMEEIFEV